MAVIDLAFPALDGQAVVQGLVQNPVQGLVATLVVAPDRVGIVPLSEVAADRLPADWAISWEWTGRFDPAHDLEGVVREHVRSHFQGLAIVLARCRVNLAAEIVLAFFLENLAAEIDPVSFPKNRVMEIDLGGTVPMEIDLGGIVLMAIVHGVTDHFVLVVTITSSTSMTSTWATTASSIIVRVGPTLAMIVTTTSVIAGRTKLVACTTG